MNDIELIAQLIAQLLACLSAIIVIYHTFIELNHCSKRTAILVRLQLITSFTGASGIMLLLLMGKDLHWSVALIAISLALRLHFDRRRKTHSSRPLKTYSPRRHQVK